MAISQYAFIPVFSPSGASFKILHILLIFNLLYQCILQKSEIIHTSSNSYIILFNYDPCNLHAFWHEMSSPPRWFKDKWEASQWLPIVTTMKSWFPVTVTKSLQEWAMSTLFTVHQKCFCLVPSWGTLPLAFTQPTEWTPVRFNVISSAHTNLLLK